MRLTQKRERQALTKNEKRNAREREKNRLIVDKNKWGADHDTCGLAPDYYYDKSYNCVSCGKPSIWTAEQQKYFFEELGKYMYAEAIHCQI